MSEQQIVNFAAEISVAACALIFATEDPVRWEQFQNFTGGGLKALGTGDLTADQARGMAARLVSLADAAMRATE